MHNDLHRKITVLRQHRCDAVIDHADAVVIGDADRYERQITNILWFRHNGSFMFESAFSDTALIFPVSGHCSSSS